MNNLEVLFLDTKQYSTTQIVEYFSIEKEECDEIFKIINETKLKEKLASYGFKKTLVKNYYSNNNKNT